MGLLDDLSGAFSRGTAIVEDGAKTMKLKADLGDARSRRQSLMSEFGSMLYPHIAKGEPYPEGIERVMSDIAAVEAEIEAIQSRISAIEQEAASRKAATAAKKVCAVCGTPVQPGASFCATCGNRVDMPKEYVSYQEAPAVSVAPAAQPQQPIAPASPVAQPAEPQQPAVPAVAAAPAAPQPAPAPRQPQADPSAQQACDNAQR